MKPFDLNLLRTLDAVLSTGSVTAAAERLHLSVPATSHALARARRLLGDPLLVRAGRRLVPTPRAEALRPQVADWLAAVQTLVAEPAARDWRAAAHRFGLRAPEGVVLGCAAALCERLQRDLPLAELRFVPEAHDDPGALREGRVDLDLGRFRPADPELRVQRFAAQGLCLAVREGHALLRGRCSAARYGGSAHVALLERAGGVDEIGLALRRLKLERRVLLREPSALAALVAAARSELVASVPRRLAQALAPRLGLQLRDLPFELPTQPLLMVWHPRHDADPAHRWLREQLADLLQAAQAPKLSDDATLAVRRPRAAPAGRR